MKRSGGGSASEAHRGRVSRRAFLGAALAGPLLGSCRGRPPIAGGMAGRSDLVGHRLRDGSFPAASRTRRTGVMVLGGGMAGLSAAWKLRRSGFEDFLLFELEERPGGNARSGRNEASGYPWGAHYVPVPGPEARAVRELFRELGLITGADAAGRPVYDERWLCHDPQERLFIHGRWQEGLFPSLGASDEDRVQLSRFRERMESYRRRRGKDGRSGFSIPVDRSSGDEELLALDRISMADFLRREGFTSPRLRWWVEYGLRDDYGCRLETTSAWAGVHYHAAREEDTEVLTWPEGNGWIVERLAAPLGERLVAGSLVVEARAEGRGAAAHVLDARSGEVTRVEARVAILALPRFVARRVVPDLRSEGGGGAPDFTYAPWVVSNLTVDRVPEGRGAPPAWDNVIHGSPSLGYVTATHQDLRFPGGPSVLTWYRPFTGPDPAAERRAIAARSWESWVEEALSDLAPALPGLRDSVSRCDVLVLAHAMVRPTPGFMWGAARREAARGRGPLLHAHSDLSGISIFEEAQYHGVRAAEEALRALGIPFSSSL
jgi:phytoene dehydrogenase-like protein